MKNVTILFLLSTLTLCCYPQKSNIKDFNYLVKKIKNNYPGYNIKVTKENSKELKDIEKTIRLSISKYPDSTSFYLRKYVSWFKDNHLRVFKVREKGKNHKVSSNNIIIKKIIFDNTRDSLEGIWFSYRGKLAIKKDTNKDIWEGISVNYSGYQKNQLMFTLKRLPNGDYKCIYYDSYQNFKETKKVASTNLGNKILEIHKGDYFVHKSDDKISDKALLNTYLPKYPNGQNTYYVALPISDSTFYLRAAGFGSDYTNRLVEKHWNDIVSRPNLIIDIRYNGGGQDIYYQMLSKLIYTNPYYSHGTEWYATDDNIKLYENALKDGSINNNENSIRNVKALIKNMKENRGGFVKHPQYGKGGMIKKDTIYEYPRNIGIIINDGNASAAEQFLLAAKHSKKVTLFGNSNTAGVLDYSNAVDIYFPSKKYKLRYPMTRSGRLPEKAIDNIGISPDVNIPYPKTKQLYDRIDDWAYYVKNYLEIL
jgi:hypothetical protein